MENFRCDNGGYDYQFVDPPLDMFLCKICHLPSKDPRLSVCCGHTFCNSCLDALKQTIRRLSFSEDVVCPMCRSEDFSTVVNKQNERAIKSLRVFCTNKDKGCEWQGELHSLTRHFENRDGCSFEEVKCANDCGILLQRQHLPSHVDNECPYRGVLCQYCSMVGRYHYITGLHFEQCDKVPLSCPNGCGVDSLLRENIEVHRKTCPLELTECPNDCGEVLQHWYLTNHISTECPRREVNCQYCQISGEYQLIEGQHKEECPKVPLCCPNECDIVSIPREDMESHRLGCPLEVIECKYHNMGCHVTMIRKDRHLHEKEKMEEHLQLTKCELMETKVKYETKTAELETKINNLESALQQNRIPMKLLFGDWVTQLHTRAMQLSSGDQVLPVIVRMSGYTQKKENNVDWYSDPFYTHKKGYKIQLNVVSNGYNSAKDTHLSVYLYLMEGLYDENLPWPLTGNFKVTLLNQISDTDHHTVTDGIDDTNQVVSIDDFDAIDVWHQPQFIKSAVLQRSKYLKKDSLFFEVSKV